MKLKGGVIIIGSLLWDDKNKRKNWRKGHLNCDEAFRVELPIRYGRYSKDRRKEYTMVFSKDCQKNKKRSGTGWIFPLKKEIDSFDELKEMGGCGSITEREKKI